MSSMENKPISKMPTIKLGCMSWTGAMLSIAIIIVRAFQSGAQPIENWSASSWFLMLLPIAFPFLFWTLLAAMWFVGYVLATIFSKS